MAILSEGHPKIPQGHWLSGECFLKKIYPQDLKRRNKKMIQKVIQKMPDMFSKNSRLVPKESDF